MSSGSDSTTLILARHGEAAYESDLWAEVGGSLTPRGRTQAARLGDDLRDRGVDHVWCSTLARAVQTAEIVAARLGVSVTTREGLREFAVGDLAGQPMRDDVFAPHFRRWLAGDLAERVIGGETGLELRDRFTAVLDEILAAHPGGTVLAVAHGGLMRSMVPVVTRMEVEPDRLGNCAAVELVHDATGWRCVGWPRYAAGA